MNRSYLKAIAVSLALAAGSAHAGTNLLDDGGFESVSIVPGDWLYFTHIGGWYAGESSDIEVRNHADGNAFEGNNFVELDTFFNSSMYQDVHTTAGQAYALSFAFQDRMGVPLESQGLEVRWNGQVIGSYNGATDWQVVRLTVNADSDVSRLEFRALGISDSYGTSLDAVSVTAVPEPHTYALLLGGLALVGACARRRR
jgi:hypothetical protein